MAIFCVLPQERVRMAPQFETVNTCILNKIYIVLYSVGESKCQERCLLRTRQLAVCGRKVPQANGGDCASKERRNRGRVAPRPAKSDEMQATNRRFSKFFFLFCLGGPTFSFPPLSFSYYHGENGCLVSVDTFLRF